MFVGITFFLVAAVLIFVLDYVGTYDEKPATEYGESVRRCLDQKSQEDEEAHKKLEEELARRHTAQPS